jgi:hypothetical protein
VLRAAVVYECARRAKRFLSRQACWKEDDRMAPGLRRDRSAGPRQKRFSYLVPQDMRSFRCPRLPSCLRSETSILQKLATHCASARESGERERESWPNRGSKHNSTHCLVQQLYFHQKRPKIHWRVDCRLFQLYNTINPVSYNS